MKSSANSLPEKADQMKETRPRPKPRLIWNRVSEQSDVRKTRRNCGDGERGTVECPCMQLTWGCKCRSWRLLEPTGARGSSSTRRGEQRGGLVDGVFVATVGYLDGCGAGVDEAQVAGWDVLTEEEEGL